MSKPVEAATNQNNLEGTATTSLAHDARALLNTLIATAPVGVAFLDRNLRYLAINTHLAEINGLPAEEHLGHTIREMVPAIAESLEQICARVLATGEPVIDVEISGETAAAPGVLRHWLESYYPVRAEDGQVLGIGVIVSEVSERTRAAAEREELLRREQRARANAERAAERAAILQRVTAALSNPHTPDQIAEIVMSQGIQAVGATAGALSLLNEDGSFAIVRMIGYPAAVTDALLGKRYGPEVVSPITEAVRERAPIWLETSDAILARYAHLVGRLTSEHLGAWAAVPLIADGRALGGLTLLFAESHAFSEADRGFMLAMAQQCAQAVERARLYEAEQHALAELEVARRSQTLLAEASVQLSASLDIQTTLETLAHLVVPHLADWCVVDLLADDGSIQTAVVAHSDAQKEAIGWQIAHRYGIDPDAPGGTPVVLRTRQSELMSEITDEILALVAHDAEHFQMLKDVGMRSSLCVALVARGRALGTIALVAAESGRRYNKADLPLIEDLARRAALAVDNARLYRQSQEAVQMRDTFFSVAAHELKTPLTAVLGQAQLIARRATREGGLSARDQRTVQVIINQAMRLNIMILAMLDSTRLEHGQLSIERLPVDLVALTHRVVEEIEPTLENHSISISAPDGPLVVMGDAVRLEQVLQNLLGNAVKYSPHGGEIRVRLEQVDQQARITVQDEGIGIPSAALPHLFERFYRAGNVATQQISGMGIGLYVVKEIVQLHGGTVGVESTPGQGSSFQVLLPRA